MNIDSFTGKSAYEQFCCKGEMMMVASDRIISKDIKLIQALDIMDSTDRKMLIICENTNFLGLISIGDIQRAILKKQDLSRPVKEYVRPNVVVASPEDDIEVIKDKMRKERIESMPIVDKNNVLVDIIEWKELFENEKNYFGKKMDYSVVIMAGGKGSRLLPLTNIIPKPLIPISDKTIIEEIMEKFTNVGCKRFFISVNYMSEVIEDFFSKKNYSNIEFIHEKKPLGTAGALYMLKKKLKDSFFVINCDTIAAFNLVELMEFHKKSKNIITVVSVIKRISIPYGTLTTKAGGVIKSIEEKPELVYQINSGMYIMEPEALEYIKDKEFIHATELIERLIADKRKVGTFPIPESAWIDMGNWNEYLKLVEQSSWKS